MNKFKLPTPGQIVEWAQTNSFTFHQTEMGTANCGCLLTALLLMSGNTLNGKTDYAVCHTLLNAPIESFYYGFDGIAFDSEQCRKEDYEYAVSVRNAVIAAGLMETTTGDAK